MKRKFNLTVSAVTGVTSVWAGTIGAPWPVTVTSFLGIAYLAWRVLD